MTTRVLAAVAASLILTTLPALAQHQHGGGHDHHGAEGRHHGGAHAAFGKAGDPAKADRTVEITVGDLYFEPASLQVEAGETVRFVVKNTGGLLHEFNIADAAYHDQHRSHVAMMVEHGMLTETGVNHDRMGMDHSGHDMGHMDHGAGNAVFVQPGETAELTWTFNKPAQLQFACNMPGHFEAGMAGGLTVE